MARKGQPKVRTGCFTCKVRKVKCDEAKPACTRCKSTGRLCDGYIMPEKLPKQRKSDSLRQQGQQKPSVILIAPHPPPRLHYSPSTMILTTRQSQYFDVFRYRIAPRYPDQEFWQRIVMREAVCDVCIRDSVTALGAVWQALCQEQNWRVESNGRQKLGFPSASEDHREAAKYFSRSISSFRGRLAREKTSMPPRSIFIATYLFFIFEQIQGNADKADALLINGLAILRRYLSVCQQEVGPESKCAAAIDDGGIAFAEGTLTRIAAINTTGLRFHAGLQDFGRQLASLIIHTPVPSPDAPLDDILAVWDVFVSRCGLWTFRTSPSQVSSDPEAVADIIETQEHIVAKYEAWRELFLELALQRNNSESIQKTLAAVWPCLRMSQMCMACFFDATELSWDDHVEECRTVLHQVEAMRAAEEEAGEAPPCETLNFVKCLYSLYVITQKCRDKELRHRALKLLRRVTNPGVAWDIKAFVISSEVHVAAEEEGRDPETGLIPASKRFSWTCYAWNDNRTEMVLTLRSSVSDEQGWTAQREVRVRPEAFGLA